MHKKLLVVFFIEIVHYCLKGVWTVWYWKNTSAKIRETRLRLEAPTSTPTMQPVQSTLNRPVLNCPLKGHTGEDFQLLLKQLGLDTIRAGSSKAGCLTQSTKLMVSSDSVKATYHKDQNLHISPAAEWLELQTDSTSHSPGSEVLLDSSVTGHHSKRSEHSTEHQYVTKHL